MQFTLITLFALVAAVVANPLVPRQKASEANEVTVESPSMTDANGNIIPFDADTVSQPNLAAGL
ncbi:hypothetical protein CCM_06119 [Cordyceps militaris CM01]|uniref:Uncharacterized protein n=2 Tax=Cordyceps militaris TaxID=73501 RepID=G3JIW5_CORMM|nr:uncharacterized protein CCM_06119 [Cordyceps militaris CM01]ATY59563.1 hypothetical protein A9K55_003480 [Cordyceps militaris]EGX91959.1 hypothetical protein CCM_06119 [Cordyceps militaris CM01]